MTKTKNCSCSQPFCLEFVFLVIGNCLLFVICYFNIIQNSGWKISTEAFSSKGIQQS